MNQTIAFATRVTVFGALLSAAAVVTARAETLKTLPGTESIAGQDDLASSMIDGIDRFLLRKLDEAADKVPSPITADGPDSLDQRRARLAHILGVRDARAKFNAPELVGTTTRPSLILRTDSVEIHAVRWPALDGVHGEGLLLTPVGDKIVADVIAVPDADQTPEEIAGLVPITGKTSAFARQLAESGCRVIVPVLLDRHLEERKRSPEGKGLPITNREWAYRSAFILGRHPIGYEVQKILAAADWFSAETPERPLGVFGWGEGGMLALYAGALDDRFDAVGVSGYFDDRRGVWAEPIDRNVFGALNGFDDVDLSAICTAKTLVVEASKGPEIDLPSNGGAPGKLSTPAAASVEREVASAQTLREVTQAKGQTEFIKSGEGSGPGGSTDALAAFLKGLSVDTELSKAESPHTDVANLLWPESRQSRQLAEIIAFNQRTLADSPYVRNKFMQRLDTSSPEAYEKTSAEFRAIFRDQVLGHFDDKRLPFTPRTRLAYDNEKWTGYEVTLDVFPDVFAYGVLLLPKDLQPGERRPVVVCQHGLEGRPQDAIEGDHYAYHDFAAKLAERGFIVFAPQNPYIFKDRFRTLQRKANPLGKTLFSVINAQHQQIVDWLKTQPNVDEKRIAFYGLSYGGKTAMRVPAVVTDYCLSICSADFNDWVWKNASTLAPESYVWTPEYEIQEFDLGSTFNYAEMAAMIAPRPFMVERGHFDGVAPDETVGYEFAKVLRLYQAKLGLKDRCEIEWFVGPHTINGQGTFRFLHKHLNWPEPK